MKISKISQNSLYSLLSYILTLFFSRVTVYLIEQDFDLPFLGYNIFKGYHIHHFAYGILLLILTAFASLFTRIPKTIALPYISLGVSLGLIFDEFGIWLKLDPEYNKSISIFASTYIGAFLIGIFLIGLRFPQVISEPSRIKK
jgi:hypothetical protein